jgi:hypothetical protein
LTPGSDTNPAVAEGLVHQVGGLWKLAHWDEWLASVELSRRPACDHFTVDNRLNGAVTLAEQAQALIKRIAR